MGSNLGSGRNCLWGEWIASVFSTFNTTTEMRPLRKAPNRHWLPTAPGVCSWCVCSLLCVCTLGWDKCRAQIPSMGHRTWSYVASNEKNSNQNLQHMYFTWIFVPLISSIICIVTTPIHILNKIKCIQNSVLKCAQYGVYQTSSTVCGRKRRWHTSWMIFCSSLFSLSSWRDFSSSLLFVDEPVFMVSCWSDCHSPRVISLRICTKKQTHHTRYNYRWDSCWWNIPEYIPPSIYYSLIIVCER